MDEMDFDKRGGGNKRGGWKIFMNSINVGDGGCGGWKFSKSAFKRDFTFIREMRVRAFRVDLHVA